MGVDLNQVRKSFEGCEAIQDLSLSIPSEKRCVLFGCSGAGKTTLLRIIAGLEQPDSGSIVIEGQEVTRKSPKARKVALLSQDSALYPQLTVRQNISTSGKKLKLSRNDLDQRVESMMDKFEIRSLQDKLPAQISGGEAQRTALARALIAEPSLLLLDEPLSQLDGRMRESSIQLLDRIQREFRPTTLVVSHDPIDAMRLADQLAILDRGQLIQSGRPAELYENPKTRIVGELLSPFGMNWLACEELDAQEFDRKDRFDASDRFLGFHAEDARLTGEKSNTPDELCLQVKVQEERFIGAGKLVSCQWRDCRLRVLADPNVSIPPQCHLVVPAGHLTAVPN
ncbi:MAG: ABC transporter ATP-binding protein [Planctomycetota bacterium]